MKSRWAVVWWQQQRVGSQVGEWWSGLVLCLGLGRKIHCGSLCCRRRVWRAGLDESCCGMWGVLWLESGSG